MKGKKHIKKYHQLRRLMRGNILVVLLFVIVAFGILLTSGAMVNKSAVDKTEQFGEAQVSSESGKQNLQLKTLTFKPKPTPANDCNHDNGRKADDPNSCYCQQTYIYCKDGKCTARDTKNSRATQTCEDANTGDWCNPNGGKSYNPKDGEGWYCLGKPVIYLYPEKPTLVDVTVRTEGKVVISDPVYPKSGWKNVLANPDGTLLYQNKQYRELFYETGSSNLNPPKQGLVFETDKLGLQLRKFIIQLGLSRADEQQEFLNWWLPRLKNLNSPYIFVSILEDTEKKRLDSVEISPKPDTFIDFIVYFSPRQTDTNPTPLILPNAPKRAGFVAVEWGGIIGE